MGEQRPRLEPIQEESEREDEFRGSETGEGEGEEEEDVETEEVMEEDKDSPLRVMRPRRVSRSLSEDRFLRTQSTDNYQEESAGFSESDWSTHTVGLSEEAAPPQQTRVGNKKRSSSAELKIKVSKPIKNIKVKPSVPKKRKSKVKKKSSPAVDPFPQWLVNLMVNIEEATTHQLVVE
ncbi:VID27-like protein [Anoplopoma fimbria]|uniref:VID27-like protein n=1 Tax=Anoplopoma fimbria TaxID=229290 RepID=UPI0023EA7B5B|nr:VID27-like protein [Anoplopoma fimbria]XP_054452591.1 VID27-like protein [Anoplopoma fimbria]